MNPLAKAALAVHNQLVAPSRRRRMRALADLSQCPISVAFYHRVADTNPNGWTISRDEFQRHVDYGSRYLDLIDLAEVQRRVRESDSPRPSLSLTFDDGYRDNNDFALPMLADRGVPCTYFVSTAHIEHQTPFGHDVAVGRPLAVNSIHDLRQWSEAGIEIGCHTRNHVDLSRVTDPAELRREIVADKQDLEQIIGRRVRYFAFPFGLPAQLTPAAIATVIDAGFDGFCSAFGAYNLVGRDEFHIRRFHGDPEFPRLENWLSFDRRKVDREPLIDYPHPSSDPATPKSSDHQLETETPVLESVS